MDHSTIVDSWKKTNAHSSNISSCFASQFKNLTFENLKFFLGYNDCSRGASNANWNQKRRKRYACWIHIMQAWMAQAAGWTSSKYYCTYLTLQDHVRSRSVSIQTEVVLVEFKILMSAENCWCWPFISFKGCQTRLPRIISLTIKLIIIDVSFLGWFVRDLTVINHIKLLGTLNDMYLDLVT